MDRICHHRGRDRRGAFTLVELLVVIGIIAMLVSFLMPALQRARRQTQIIRCASNLRQWGQGLLIYAQDNRGQLPRSLSSSGGTFMYLYLASVNNDTNSFGFLSPQDVGTISIERLKKYIPGPDATHQVLTKVWRCPSADEEFRDVIDADNKMLWSSYGAVQLDYNYFAHPAPAGSWSANPAVVSDPKQLMTDRLDASKLWMSDTLFRWASWSGGPSAYWSYNHGIRSAARHGLQNAPSPDITGVNRLYGDGHVAWKSRGEFNLPALIAGTAAIGTDYITVWPGLADKVMY